MVDVLDNFEQDSLPKEEKRIALLPIWIKLFAWFFLALLFVIPAMLLLNYIFDQAISLRIFGILLQLPLSVNEALVLALFFFYGFASFGLLWGKYWGITICISAGILGIFFSPFFHSFATPFGLDIIIYFIFIYRLGKLKHYWEGV